jgi:hypothetical protein
MGQEAEAEQQRNQGTKKGLNNKDAKTPRGGEQQRNEATKGTRSPLLCCLVTWLFNPNARTSFGRFPHFLPSSFILLPSLFGFPSTLNSQPTTTFSDSGVGWAARATAAAVWSRGKRWEIRRRTSRRRLKTSRATSSWRVKSEE